MKAQVLDLFKDLELKKNGSEQYDHASAQILLKGVESRLKQIWNTSDIGNGMRKLLDKKENFINKVRSTDAVTAEHVLKRSKRAAEALNTTPPTVPDIVLRADAIAEAEDQNQLSQRIVGAKEGASESIKKLVGSDVLDAVLRTADGSDWKGIDDYSLHDVLAAVIAGANRPTTAEVHENLLEALTTDFDFRKKMSTNLEALRTNCTRLGNYGIMINEPMLVLIVFMNIEEAIQHPWGRDFRARMEAIRELYKHDYVHTATSLAAIMLELGKADSMRDMKVAPAPNNLRSGSANSVAASISRVQDMMEGLSSASEYGASNSGDESAYSASESDDSESSGEREKRAAKAKRKKARDIEKFKRAPGMWNARRRKPPGGKYPPVKYPPNNCPHCKKYDRHRGHPSYPDKQCFFNAKWKGFRPRYAANIMKVKFKERDDFTEALGGYRDVSASDSE